MKNPEFYLCFGRHGRYGSDTAIEREDMLSAYLMGKQLQLILPDCTAIYHSPIARAVETARFNALGMKCNHLLETEFLAEDASTFAIRSFLNRLLQNSDDHVHYYHFVTHLPVVEKLGLPFLSAGEVCLLSAANREEMLAENFTVQIISKPIVQIELLQNFPNLATLSTDEIYSCLANKY